MKQIIEDIFSYNGISAKDGEALWTTLYILYNSPDRKYHNLLHIAKCLDYFNEYFDDYIVSYCDELSRVYDILSLAILFHDIVYDTEAKDNEEKSACYAVDVLTKFKFPENIISEVKNCILATKHQHLTDNFLEQIMCDVDLASLAAPRNEFIINNLNIRAEYSALPDEVFYKGNHQLLQSLIDRPIYQTCYFYDRFEKKATQNIEYILKQQENYIS